MHARCISDAIKEGRLIREGIWTESIAVGNESFVKEIAAKEKRRKRLYIAANEDGAWYLKEDPRGYVGSLEAKEGLEK